MACRVRHQPLPFPAFYVLPQSRVVAPYDIQRFFEEVHSTAVKALAATGNSIDYSHDPIRQEAITPRSIKSKKTIRRQEYGDLKRAFFDGGYMD